MMQNTDPITMDEVRGLVLRELPHWIETDPALRRKLVEVAVREDEKLAEKAVPPGKVTYEEFLDWCDEDTWAEWVDGEVIMFSPASPEHQRLTGFLARVLGNYVQERGLGEVLSAPLAMRLEHGREPDLLFITTAHTDRLYKGGLQGPADLVVEIISPESAGRDRGEKFYEYARGGVPEYWLIDPQEHWAEFYHLEARHYRLAFGGDEGVYRSAVLPGFWLRVEWLWQDPLPSPIRVLGEIAEIDADLVDAFVQALARGRSTE